MYNFHRIFRVFSLSQFSLVNFLCDQTFSLDLPHVHTQTFLLPSSKILFRLWCHESRQNRNVLVAFINVYVSVHVYLFAGSWLILVTTDVQKRDINSKNRLMAILIESPEPPRSNTRMTWPSLPEIPKQILQRPFSNLFAISFIRCLFLTCVIAYQSAIVLS